MVDMWTDGRVKIVLSSSQCVQTSAITLTWYGYPGFSTAIHEFAAVIHDFMR
jgi:hypothetical protein